MATKLTGIKSMGPGRWQIFASAKDETRPGRRKELKRIVRGSLEEAIAARAALVDEVRNGPGAAGWRPTLTDYARSWLGRKVADLKPSTANKYESDLSCHILPALGDVYVDALRPPHVARFVADQTMGRTSTRKAYNPRTVAQRLRLLKQLARDAMADGVTAVDFAGPVRPPRGASVSPWHEDRPNLLTPEELRAFLAEVPAHWYPLVVTLALTGMRWGEASGLSWEDVSFEAGTITVRRSNYHGTIVTPKNANARRTIGMAPELADILRRHRARQVAEQHPGLKAGWVFPTAQGKLIRSYPLQKVVRDAADRAGIEAYLNVHGLRRTFNNMLRQLATATVTRAIVGHADERMTTHYSVVSADEKRAAAGQVLRLVVGTEGNTEAPSQLPGQEWDITE